MQIAWRLKSLAFKAADRLPPALLYAAQKHLTGYSRAPITKISKSWEFHAAAIQKHGARSILEFGAGKSLAQNLYLSTLGVDQTLIDLNPMLDMDLVCRAVARLEALGVKLNGAPRSIADLQKRYRITYLAPVDMRHTNFADAQFDACISTNTLEHIPRASLVDIFQEVKRVLRPGGIVSAKIDYGDHYARTDRSIKRGHFLRYSEREWARHNHKTHYQNRLRHEHYRELAALCGLGTAFDEAFAPDPPEPAAAGMLTGNESDWCTAGHYVWLKDA